MGLLFYCKCRVQIEFKLRGGKLYCPLYTSDTSRRQKCIERIIADGASNVEPIQPIVATVAKTCTTTKMNMGLVFSLMGSDTLGKNTAVVNT